MIDYLFHTFEEEHIQNLDEEKSISYLNIIKHN